MRSRPLPLKECLHLRVYIAQNTHKLQMLLRCRIISAVSLYYETAQWTPFPLCSMYKGIPRFNRTKALYHFRKGSSECTPVICLLQFCSEIAILQ
jgi:hypothetical protein